MKVILTEDYMTVQEAARDLGVTDAAVRAAILKGRLDAVALFGRKLVPRNALASYKSRTQPDGVKPVGRPRKQSTSSFSASTFTTLASEETLREIWDTPEEDEAWRDL